ncbi:MAG: archease [Candidatus Aminicenantes bacterium]|nr:archease [Candidatus Aminicenantes bacterium]
MMIKKRALKNPPFQYLDHPADAKFQAFGETFEEAFAHAALAVVSLMWEPEKIIKRQRRTVLVQGKDLEQLLFKFLSEILYLYEAKGFLLASARDLKIIKHENGYSLEAVLEGDNLSSNYTIFGEVKAITYHDMIIRKNDEVLIQVVVDM